MASRRFFLESTAAVLVMGCGRATVAADDTGTPQDTGDSAPPACPDPFEGGTLVALLDFVDDGDSPTETRLEEGLDGRYAIDLQSLDEDAPDIPAERFFLRTFEPDRIDRDKPWRIRVHGLVDEELELDPDDLDARDMGSVLIECSGNSGNRAYGLISAGRWEGVPLSELLEQASIQTRAVAVKVSGFDDHSQPSEGGHSTPGCAWIFTLQDLVDTGAFLATRLDGQDLDADHGHPVRLVVPGWYGCACVKWVDDIELVDAGEPATSQMAEFATRTHQTSAHALAADYAPARIEQAAMPVRIEQWELDDETVYRVVGILWGGTEPITELRIRFDEDEDWQAVELCPEHSDNRTWTVWSTSWRPTKTGRHTLRCRVEESTPQQRLDSGFYDRQVRID
jgi:DMSO/TMAO reductase YedYZ molybdopterin-dependent catalytic subunit